MVCERCRITFSTGLEDCGEHDKLTREVSSLHTLFRRLEKEMNTVGSPLNSSDDNCRKEIEAIVLGCQKDLIVLDRILEKYNALGETQGGFRKLRHKILFGNRRMADLPNLRAKMTYYTSVLQMQLQLVKTDAQDSPRLPEGSHHSIDSRPSILRTSASDVQQTNLISPPAPNINAGTTLLDAITKQKKVAFMLPPPALDPDTPMHSKSFGTGEASLLIMLKPRMGLSRRRTTEEAFAMTPLDWTLNPMFGRRRIPNSSSNGKIRIDARGLTAQEQVIASCMPQNERRCGSSMAPQRYSQRDLIAN